MRKLDFEEILLDVGDFGPYQRNILYYFLLPTSCLMPFLTMPVIFMVSVPEHWCYVPEVTSANLSIAEQRALISPSKESSCRMHDLNYSSLLMSNNWTVPGNVSNKLCDHGWQYDTTKYDSTIATQWNLVCHDFHYVSLLLMCIQFGSIILTPVYGALSDKIGRKKVFFIVVIVSGVSSVISIFMENFFAFLVLRTINGGMMPSLFQLPFIIALELVAPEKRTRLNGMVCIIWSFGGCFVPLLVYFCRGWVPITICSSVVTFTFLIYWAFLPESPRWLVSQQLYDEAAAIMASIGEKNGKPQDRKELRAKLKIIGEKMIEDKRTSGATDSVVDLFKYSQLRKTFIICTICWVADRFAYDGLQLNVTNLSGNEFLNFFLLVLMEAPGYMTAWYLLEKYGRRWCTAIGFLLTGVVCLVATIQFPYSDLVSSMMGKFLGAAAYMATYQQCSELYPTVVRSLGMGMSSTLSSVIALAIPYVVYFGTYGRYIPFIIIACICLVAGLLATVLPETLNENLPQSIQDREDFGLKQKFFSWNRRRMSVCRERAESLRMRPQEEESKIP